MRKFKIHPNTLCVATPNGVLKDKEAEYKEEIWGEEEANRLVKEKYLVEVKKDKDKK